MQLNFCMISIEWKPWQTIATQFPYLHYPTSPNCIHTLLDFVLCSSVYATNITTHKGFGMVSYIIMFSLFRWNSANWPCMFLDWGQLLFLHWCSERESPSEVWWWFKQFAVIRNMLPVHHLAYQVQGIRRLQEKHGYCSAIRLQRFYVYLEVMTYLRVFKTNIILFKLKFCFCWRIILCALLFIYWKQYNITKYMQLHNLYCFSIHNLQSNYTLCFFLIFAFWWVGLAWSVRTLKLRTAH